MAETPPKKARPESKSAAGRVAGPAARLGRKAAEAAKRRGREVHESFKENLWPSLVEAFQGPAGWRLAVPCGLAALLALILALDLILNASPGQALGALLLAAVSVRLLYELWLRRLPVFGGRLSVNQLLFLVCLGVLLAGLVRGQSLLAGAMSAAGHGLPLLAMAYAVPLATGPMMVSLFMGRQAGMIFALAASLLAAMVWPQFSGPFLFYLFSGMVAAHYTLSGRTRMSMIAAGTWSALAGLVTLAAVAVLQGWLLSNQFVASVGAAVIGPLVSGLLAAGLAPLAESCFGFISAPSLMEMASLDHPLLQDLMLRAPGTYHHSLVIGSMAEAAAKAIGADPLLARVAALYHDLGKVKKADYFIENQTMGPNRHEKLAPSMSALILASHVKEGVETAKAHHLGRPIIDIIAQHHGTRLIHYFYNKAATAAREAGREEPDPEAFRYPGPRPQTREAGLIMLADTVEAASRTLENPTPARLQGVVQSQINKVFAEGQLDECELTLKDLHKIAKVFNKSLTGIFHQRVEYPKAENGSAKQSGTGDRQSPKQAPDKPAGSGDPDQADLRRLGIG